MKLLSRTAFVLSMALAACGGDDDGGDGSGIDAAGGIDGPPACVLPEQTITCTVGDDTACTNACGGAFCYNFEQLPSPVCTSNCTPGDTSCPVGWTCNNMGRCRPPG